jgi:hypothetical protein
MSMQEKNLAWLRRRAYDRTIHKIERLLREARRRFKGAVWPDDKIELLLEDLR